MKKNYLITMAVAILFSSCKKESLTAPNTSAIAIKTEVGDVTLKDGRLNFSKATTFSSFMENVLSDTSKTEIDNKVSKLLGKTGFRSLYALNKGKAKAKQMIMSLDTTAEEVVDSLVEDNNFAGVLSEDRDIIVEDNIYRVTDYGTFVTSKDSIDLLNRFIAKYDQSGEPEVFLSKGKRKVKTQGVKTNKLAAPVEEISTGINDLYAVGALNSGVYRYDTFGFSKDIDGDTFDSIVSPISVGTPVSVAGKNDLSGFPYSIMKSNELKAKTSWLGKLWNTITWGDPFYDYFNDNYRCRLNFFNQNFVLWSSVGVNVKYQKKGWFWWNKKNTDELRLGWNGIIYSSDYSYPNMQPPPNLNAANPYAGNINLSELKPPGGRNYLVLPFYADIFGYEINSDNVIKDSYINKALSAGWGALKSKLQTSATNKVMQPDGTLKNYTLAQLEAMPKAVYYPYKPGGQYKVYLGRAEYVSFNEDKIEKDFDFATAIITISGSTAKWSSGNPNVSGTPSSTFKIQEALVYGLARNGSTWKGVKIYVH